MKNIFKALAILLIFSCHAKALTLNQLQSEVRLRVKDAQSINQRYTDSQITNFINEAQRDVVNVTWAIQKSTTFALASGSTYYALPTDLIAIGRVTHRKTVIPEATLDQQDALGSPWENAGAGLPSKYFQDMSQPGNIGFYPWPNSGTSTGTVNINYFAQASVLASSSDVPFNSLNRLLPYHDLLILYAAYRIYLIEGKEDKATIYRQEYESRLTVMRDRVGSKPNYNPGFSGEHK